MYNPFFPTSYQPLQPVQTPPQPQSQNGIVWVQGESGAKSYMVPAGQSALLMDSESEVFYIKSSDQSGMPLPLRIFDYKERVEEKESVTESKYVTHEELEKRIAEITEVKRDESII